MTNAIFVLTVVVGLIGAAASAGYQREGDFRPHQGGGDRHDDDSHEGGGGRRRDGKFVLIEQLTEIHSTVCFGLPGPNFTRPNNNNNNNNGNQRRAVPPPKNVTDEEARLVRDVARLAETFEGKAVTDADCAALTTAEQRLIDFRRNNSIPCGAFEDNDRPQFGQQQGSQQGPRPAAPGNFNGNNNNNNGGARGSSFAQQQQQQHQPAARPATGIFNGNNFQPNNNNMHMMQQQPHQQQQHALGRR